MTFSVPLLNAINYWQIGGNTKQKQARGEELKKQCEKLPAQFRSAYLVCYRQVSLVQKPLWQLLADGSLDETISAWTHDLGVAKSFKGGVPQPGYQGVIFAWLPEPGSVIVNLDALFRDAEFTRVVEANIKNIDRFNDGIGRYWNSQQEIVIEKAQIEPDEVVALGGYSSSPEEIAMQIFDRIPTEEDKAIVLEMIQKSGAKLGPVWIDIEQTDRVMMRLKPVVEELRAIKARQEQA